jgi:hypothetical protein
LTQGEAKLTPDELIEKARSIIGPKGQDDYVIAPVEHVQLFRDKAPAFARILGRSEIASAAEEYERLDREAIEARKEFKSTANRANLWVLLTSVVSVVLLVIGALVPSKRDLLGRVAATAAADTSKPATAAAIGDRTPVRVLVAAIGIALFLTGGMAAVALRSLQTKDLLGAFKESRAGAELQRTRYFKLVTDAEAGAGAGDAEATPPQPMEIPLPLLQLEYFRRYQLDVQLDYYETRGKEHKIAANHMIDLGIRATEVATVVSMAAGLLGAVFNPHLAALAALSAIGTAVTHYATTREAVDQDRTNAERYRKAADAFRTLKAQLDAVRQAAATAQRKPLRAFVAAVEEQTAREHSQWLDAAKQINVALDGLNKALAEAQAVGRSPQSTPEPTPS